MSRPVDSWEMMVRFLFAPAAARSSRHEVGRNYNVWLYPLCAVLIALLLYVVLR